MAPDVCVIVGTEDRVRLAAVVGDRRRPLKHVQRARIVFGGAADGSGGRPPGGHQPAGGLALAMAFCATRRGDPASRDYRQRRWPRFWP